MKRFKQAVMIALICYLNAVTAAPTKSCYNSSRATAYIQKFNIDLSQFRNVRDFCNPRNELISLFETFDYVASLEFDESVVGPQMPGLVGFNYSFYLEQSILSVIRETHSQADGSMDPKTGELSIGPGFIKNKDVVERAAVLIHEARHRSQLNNGYEHVKCRQGEFLGQYACDNSFEAGGAYAVEVEFLMRIAYSAKNVSEEVKASARSTAIHTLEGNFLRR